jgi:hypothetical protein
LIARLADGSYAKACELLGEDLRQMRFDVVNLLRTMLTPRGFVLRLTHEIEQSSGERDRAKIERMLTLLLLWVRDAFALSVSEREDVIVNIDQIEDLKRFAGRFGSQAGLDAAARAIERAIELVRRNINITLLLTTLAFNLRTVLLARTSKE